MADERKRESERLSKIPNGPKRAHKEIEQTEEYELNNSSSSNDYNKSSSSSKRQKVCLYRDQNNESFDSDSFKNTLGSPSWSLDSGPWQLASSKTASLGSLELSSMIKKCDMTNLNSLTMSQSMSFQCEDAMSSPFPQTQEMTSPSPSTKQPPSLNSFSMKQAMMAFSSNTTTTSTSPQSVDMVSLSSQTSILNSEENGGSQSQEIYSQYLSSAQSSYESSETENTQNTSSTHNISCTTSKSSFEREKVALVCTDYSVKCETSSERQQSVLTTNETKDQQHSDKSDKESDSEINIRHETNSELKENFASCKKNPGHHDFYSPKKLKVTDLPQEIQHEDSVTFFQCLSKLVIQISVSSTSSGRSKHDIYSSYIGTDKIRNGSGFIASTDEVISTIRCKQKNCPHNEDFESSYTIDSPGLDRTLSNNSTVSTSSCSSSGSTSRNGQSKKHCIYGGVNVKTNRHVIFDKSEADNACVSFFFNSSDRKEVVRGHVSSIIGVNNDQDHITLHVMSHSKPLLNTIDLHLKNARSSYVQMIKSTHNTQQNHRSNKLSWVAVISHPHGTANSVSFGRLRKEEKETKRVIKYYDAATCPGSSGGLVITPTLLHLQWPGAVHSSFCQKSKYNVSLDSRCQELDASDIGEMNKNILNKKESLPENQYQL